MKQKLLDNVIGVTVAFALFFCLTAIVGCTTGTPQVSQMPVQQVTQAPVPRIIVVTNIVAGVPQVVTVTNTVMVPVTNTVMQTVTNTVYAPNTAQIQSVGTTLSTLNAMSAPVNPYSVAITPLIGWGVALAGFVSAGVAAYKNNTKSGVLNAIIAGVEAAAPGGNDLTPVTTASIKQSVAAAAMKQGVADDVQAAVQKAT